MNTAKPIRFLWRAFRNMLCLTPASQRLMFPSAMLASRFGRGDAEYAWNVFLHHLTQLRKAGFQSARYVLEIGPGRNLGTALLWWVLLTSDNENKLVRIFCWDVFENAKPDATGFWSELALGLLEKSPETLEDGAASSAIRQRLLEVAEGRSIPDIVYRVEPLTTFESAMGSDGQTFDLAYSHAAIEHIWHIDEFWNAMGRLTAPDGWHSHRIDLADHGRRETNYIEMLEWSALGYWLTMRFIPGAINRWRACHHLEKLAELGFKILIQQCSLADRLPIPLHRVSAAFCRLREIELRTTALDVVGIRAPR
ncbi:MAG: hypothetical protein NTV11_09680 [Rhodocyclales bacterium]|nr:hypothetical protein [Rhodocyclales bacterium]